MHKAVPSFIAVALSCGSASVLAAGQMKPGLWEMTIQSDAMKNMPKMSPEQIRQMKQMGVNMPEMRDGGMVSKVCISKEMAERDEPMGSTQKETGCQTKNYQKSGNAYSADIVCNGEMKGEGKIKGSYSGNEKFTSTYDFKGTVHGQQISQRQETSGRWLAADCGSVKPAGDAAKK